MSGYGEQPRKAIEDSYENHLIQEELHTENLHKLHQSIQKLPARQKEVINLRYYQNLATEETKCVRFFQVSSVMHITNTLSPNPYLCNISQ